MEYHIKLIEQAFDPRKPSRLSHNYSTHPLMQLDELEKLENRFQQQGNGHVKFVSKGTKATRNK